MSAIWVTGAAGYSGRFVLEALAQRGLSERVVALDVIEFESANAKTAVAIDLRDTDAVRDLAKTHAPSHVLHLAGTLHPTPRDQMYAINVGCSAGLLCGIALAGQSPAVLTVGSAAEYGVPQRTPIDEAHPTLPVNPYGQSKLAQSLTVEALCSRHGWRSVVARSFNLIGPGLAPSLVPGRIAEQLRDPDCETIKLGKTSSVRDFIDIRDAADAYVTLLLSDAVGHYNVCSGVGTSIDELLALMIRCSGRDIGSETDSAAIRADEADVSIGANARLLADTNWQQRFSLEQSASDLVSA